MEKIDYKKKLKELYMPSAKKVSLVEVPAMSFVMIDGAGAPQTEENDNQDFMDAISACYSITYTLKFMYKDKPKPKGYFEYVVPPLETLWWMKDGSEFDVKRVNDWRWTVMIMQPEFYTLEMIEKARLQAKEKKELSALDKVRVESFEEGLSVQILHIGPYSEEAENIQKLKDFAGEQGLIIHGKHHEIYLSDPNRVAPEKLKTVLRQQVKKA